jgi:hypothetical protein
MCLLPSVRVIPVSVDGNDVAMLIQHSNTFKVKVTGSAVMTDEISVAIAAKFIGCLYNTEFQQFAE